MSHGRKTSFHELLPWWNVSNRHHLEDRTKKNILHEPNSHYVTNSRQGPWTLAQLRSVCSRKTSTSKWKMEIDKNQHWLIHLECKMHSTFTSHGGFSCTIFKISCRCPSTEYSVFYPAWANLVRTNHCHLEWKTFGNVSHDIAGKSALKRSTLSAAWLWANRLLACFTAYCYGT